MKKLILLSLCLFVAGCGGNGIVVKKFKPAYIVHVPELQKLDNVADLKNYAGYLDKGDSFPLELNFNDKILGVRQKSIDIVMKKRLFFMVKVPDNPTKEELLRIEKLDFDTMSEAEQKSFFSRYMLYVATDAEHWAPMNDGRALKRVLGIKGGTFSFGIGMNKAEGVKSALSIKTER